MTRKEAFEYARRIRNKTKDASIIVLDGECIDAILSNPWHKVSEELPPYDKVVIVAYGGNTDDCCFNHRSNNSEVKTTEHDWCEIGYKGEPTHWMEIPEIKED